MRRCGVVVVAGLLALAGCGGKGKTATHTTASAPTTTSQTSPKATTGGPKDCNALGINPTRMREGTCTHAGITYVIVDEDHVLKLRTLTAKLGGLHTAASLSGSQPATAQGKFVILSITFTNRMALPQSVDRSGTQQTGLILGGTVYKEDVSVEKSLDSASCLSRNAAIAPRKSETCDVVFDVPSSSAAELGKHASGDLYVVDFGADLAGSTPVQTVGQIRLYH